MKNKDVLKAYETFSGTASTILRQLGFAGIALIWIFKSESEGKAVIPSELISAAIWIVIGLTFDLFHYLVGAAIWAGFNLYNENKGVKNDHEFEAPRPINWITVFLFVAKSVVMIVAYILILRFLWLRFR